MTFLSSFQGRASVSQSSPDTLSSPSVASSVFSSILNASSVLEASHAGMDAAFFHKDDPALFADDRQQLMRLSGAYNVTAEPVRPKGKKLCAVKDVQICLFYGTERRLASRHVMRTLHKAAVEAAWRREARVARSGSSSWSNSQRSELLRRGSVRGFVAVEVRGAHKVASLAGQGSNIVFVRENEASSWHGARRQGKN